MAIKQNGTIITPSLKKILKITSLDCGIKSVIFTKKHMLRNIKNFVLKNPYYKLEDFLDSNLNC